MHKPYDVPLPTEPRDQRQVEQFYKALLDKFRLSLNSLQQGLGNSFAQDPDLFSEPLETLAHAIGKCLGGSEPARIKETRIMRWSPAEIRNACQRIWVLTARAGQPRTQG